MEIISGAKAGVSATTERGRATFFIPEAGAVTLRTSKANYRTATTTAMLDRERDNARVVLESEGPPIDLSGRRLLEVRANGTCEQLPANLRIRTYPVSFVSSSRGVFMAEPLDQIFRQFFMAVLVSAEEASFGVEDWINEEAGIIEQLPDNNTLQIHLWTGVIPVANAKAISTPVEGTISYCDASNKCTAVCDSKAHQLMLTQR